MKQFAQKLEEFFSAFESDIAIDISAYQNEIRELLTVVTSEYERLDEIKARLRVVEDENVELRCIIVNDCRAKLILLSDPNAETKAEELASLPSDALKTGRAEIVKRFDSQFNPEKDVGSKSPSSSDLALIHFEAFQS